MTKKFGKDILQFPRGHRVSNQPPLLMIEQLLRGEDRPKLHFMRTFKAKIDLPANECPEKLKAGMRCILVIGTPCNLKIINALFTKVSKNKEIIHIELEIRCDQKVLPIRAIELVKEDIQRSSKNVEKPRDSNV